MEDTNVTPFPKEKIKNEDSSLVSSLSPREIVSELDRYVVGQNKAKKAVAIALRNRWRRQALKGEMKNEVLPKNILMIGPTGVGKTEISRRLSKLAEAPFVKVEATKFTEVGYVGRDVEQIIRDLLEIAIAMEELTKADISAAVLPPHNWVKGTGENFEGDLTFFAGAPHMKVDLDTLGCDFFAFSGHKMLAPTGIGVLWVRKSVLQTMNPFHGGGDMIREVHKYETTWNDLPYKFEAGTPSIADVIGFGAAIDYLTKIGMDNVRQHEIELTKYAIDEFSKVPGLHIYGTKDITKRGGVISFNFADVHPHDVAQIIDGEGIALRSGHHCAQVLMERLNVAATSRASFYIYNTKADVDALINSLHIVAKVFKL